MNSRSSLLWGLTLLVSSLAAPSTGEAGIIPWTYDAIFGPVGSMGYTGYRGAYSAGYAPYSAGYAPYGARYAPAWGDMYSTGYAPYSAGYAPAGDYYAGYAGGWAGGGCNTCNAGPVYANFGGADCGCSPCGGGGCNACVGGNCATGQCSANMAPAGNPTPIPENRTAPPAANPNGSTWDRQPRDTVRDTDRPYDGPSERNYNAPPDRNYAAPPTTVPRRDPMNEPMPPARSQERDGFGPRTPGSDAPMYNPNGPESGGSFRQPVPTSPSTSPTTPTPGLNSGEDDFGVNRPNYPSTTPSNSAPATTPSTAPSTPVTPTPDLGSPDSSESSSLRRPLPLEFTPVTDDAPSARPLDLDSRLTWESGVRMERQAVRSGHTAPAVVRTAVRPSRDWSVSAPKISLARDR